MCSEFLFKTHADNEEESADPFLSKSSCSINHLCIDATSRSQVAEAFQWDVCGLNILRFRSPSAMGRVKRPTGDMVIHHQVDNVVDLRA